MQKHTPRVLVVAQLLGDEVRQTASRVGWSASEPGGTEKQKRTASDFYR